MRPRLSSFAAPVVIACALSAACTAPPPEPESNRPPPAPVASAITELKIDDTVVGTGATAAKGDRVSMHYTGRLHSNGSEFDSSRDREPFTFTIGNDQVIEGWHQGVVGMKVGGKRKITIPHELAYGAAGRPPKIPPKAALVFDLELVSIEGKGAPAGSASASTSAAPAASGSPSASPDASAPTSSAAPNAKAKPKTK